jgi:biotin carboxyl carrier protein
MIYEVTIGSKAHRVELMREGQGWLCKLNGAEFPLDAVSTQDGVLSLVLGGKSYEARQEVTAGETLVAVDRQRFVVQVRDPRSLRSRRASDSGGHGPRKITAPMPGKVVRILAPAGTAVEAGQPILVIEAMKMQNELKSPKKGVVKKLVVSEGAAVEVGQALGEVE